MRAVSKTPEKGHAKPQPEGKFGPKFQVALGISLTAIAGYVDAIGFLALGGLFASFMSGASISLGIAMSGGQWGMLFEAANLICVFLVGAIGATVLTGLTGIVGMPLALLVEGVLLIAAVLMTLEGWGPYAAILPVVAAMGVQNTIVRPVNGVRLGVTFMTGTLVNLGEGIGRAILGRGRPRSWYPHFLLWLSFSIGAAVGAWFYASYGFLAVSGPAVVVTLLAIVVLAIVLFRRWRRVRRVTRRMAR